MIIPCACVLVPGPGLVLFKFRCAEYSRLPGKAGRCIFLGDILRRMSLVQVVCVTIGLVGPRREIGHAPGIATIRRPLSYM